MVDIQPHYLLSHTKNKLYDLNIKLKSFLYSTSIQNSNNLKFNFAYTMMDSILEVMSCYINGSTTYKKYFSI